MQTTTRQADMLLVDQELEALKWLPASEVTTEELSSIIGGRKDIFNAFYANVATGMRARGNEMLKAVARYRDKNIELLSSPYMTNYTIFGAEDQKIVWKVTGLKEEDVAAVIKELKADIRAECKLKGYKIPASDFVNVTPFRVILLLMMRYYIERGDKKSLETLCSYAGYSMFYTLFLNSFPHGVRAETMIYTVNTMTKKHKLRTQEDIDGLLTYGISLCVNSYKKRIMDCTDQDIIYVIGQWKSRLRGYIVGLAKLYYENDKAKNASFTSDEKVDTEDGSDFVERPTNASNIEKLSMEYTQRFFQKPVDDQLILVASRMTEVAKQEVKNALSALRADKARIPEVRQFYQAIFYLYLQESNMSEIDVHSKKFLAVMDAVYRKGNAKEPNIVTIKELLGKWLGIVAPAYKEATTSTKAANLRKAVYQYFIFAVALRQ